MSLPPRAPAVVDWLLRQLAARLALEPEDLDLDMPFADLGLDSAEALSLTFDLGQWAGLRLPETLLWEYPTVRAVATHVEAAALPGAAAG